MKTIFTTKLWLMTLIIIGVASVNAQTPYVHYNFDADGNDSQGNVNLTVGPNVTFVNDPDRGMVAETTILDATSDVTLDANGSWFTTGMTAYTISTWFKYEDLTNWYGAIFAYGQGTTNNAKFTYFSPSYAGWTRLGIQATLTGFGASANTVLAKDGGVTVGSRNQTAGDEDWSTPDWHHVAVVYDVTKITIYLDGAVWLSGTAEVSIADQIADGLDTYKIGRNVHATQQRMTARYDDFKVFHTGLSPVEIAMEAGKAITYNGSFSTTPDATSAVSIEANYSEDADLEVASMLVKSGATLTVKSGRTLTIGNYLEVEGSLVVESGASLITTGDVVGNVSITRTTSFDMNTGKYSVVGSPVATATSTNLGTNAVVYSYNEENADISDNSLNRFESVASGSSMTPGVGYFSAFTGDASGAVTFIGAPNSGNVDVAVTNTVDGFNLLSNPYPAAIDIAAFIGDADNNELSGSIYIWDDNNAPGTRGTNADYITVNSSGVVSTDSEAGGNSSFDGKIRSVQGFFVQATAAGTVTFKNAHRVSGTNDDNSFFRQGIDFTRFKVFVKGNDLYSETLLAFRDEATTEIDRLFDAERFESNNPLQIYSLIGRQHFTIQSLPSLNQETSVPIGFSVDADGVYEVNIGAIENLPEGYDIMLIDHELNASYSLGGGVSLNLVSGTYDDRFSISLRKSNILNLGNQVSNINVFSADGQAKIWVPYLTASNENVTVEIYDLLGHKVNRFSAAFINGQWEGRLSDRKGVFFIVVTSADGQVFKEKFLSK